MNWHAHDPNIRKHDEFVSALQMWLLVLPPNVAALDVRLCDPGAAGESTVTISPTQNPRAATITIILDDAGGLAIMVKKAWFFHEAPIGTQVLPVCDAIVSGRLHETRWEWQGRSVGRVVWVDVTEDCRLNSDLNRAPGPFRWLLPIVARHDISWPPYAEHQ
jgi:hypothetical protein